MVEMYAHPAATHGPLRRGEAVRAVGTPVAVHPTPPATRPTTPWDPCSEFRPPCSLGLAPGRIATSWYLGCCHHL